MSADHATGVAAVVVVAMPDEAEPFLALADRVGPESAIGRAVLRRLELAGTPVLLVRSGIGLVNAASAATAALLGPVRGDDAPRVPPVPAELPAEQPVELAVELPGAAPARPVLVSAGSAGGLGTEVRVGDVVVGAQHAYTDADARAFGYVRGQVPGMPETYDGDADLVAVAASVRATHVGADPGSTDRHSTPTVEHDLTIRTGLVLSGDSFVDANLVDDVRGRFDGALSVDMESTALAQVAYSHGVPFVSVRGISDLCGPVAGEDFLAHVDDAAERSAAVVARMLVAVSAGRGGTGARSRR